MRHLGIDFGERRVGLAISDENGRVATPLTTLGRTSDAQVIEAILAVADREEVEHLVVGEPLGTHGRPGRAAERVRGFARKLAAATELPVSLTDETLTSVEASRKLGRRGRRTGRVDAMAAQILLQQALDEAEGKRPLEDGKVP